MITYILQCLVIQLIFLLVYDLFLKRETFFQWNRIYLLTTFVSSLIFPLIQFDFLKTTAPEKLVEYHEFLLQLDEVVIAEHTNTNFLKTIDRSYVLYIIIASAMTFWFVIKLYHIYKLKKRGAVFFEKHYVRVVLPKSKQAFSFFKYIFLGENLPNEKLQAILEHEMVHVRQWHSLDLLLFELMRIVLWFNPLVYIYQNRISELHEFIADEQASKIDKKKQYELLLSKILESQNFSLVNQFFKQSLIKKRIVMLTKQKSKSIYQLKYTLLLPLVLGILIYTSCNGAQVLNTEEVTTIEGEWDRTIIAFNTVEEVPTFPGCEGVEDKRMCFKEKIQKHIVKHFRIPEKEKEQDFQGEVEILLVILKDGVIENHTNIPNKTINDEIERVVNLLPKMNPGKYKDKITEIFYRFPLSWKFYNQQENDVSILSRKPNVVMGMIVTGKLDESGKNFIGKVSDKDGLLPGANITVKGKKEKTVSDFDGKFEISATKGDIIIVQYTEFPTVNFLVKE